VLRNAQFGRWLPNVLENPVWIKWIEPCLSSAREDVAGGEYLISRAAVKRREVLFAYCVCTFTIQSFHLLTIGSLQRAEHSYIAWLKLVGRVRREPAQNYVVLKAELHNF
jgi:hypothetical protein